MAQTATGMKYLMAEKHQSLSEILNPVHQLTFKDIDDLSDIIQGAGITPTRTSIFKDIFKSWEELTHGKIELSGVCCTPLEGNIRNYNDCDKCEGYTEKKLFQRALLQKKHFFCEAEKPNPTDRKYYSIASQKGETHSNEEFKKDYLAYESALKHVLFEGCEWDGKRVGHSDKVRVSFHANNSTLWHGGSIVMGNPTIADYITEIDRYNRTATHSIALKWTEHFFNKLLNSITIPIN